MYNPVNLTVQPSVVLKQSQYAIHLALLLAYAHLLLNTTRYSTLLYLVPVLLIQGLYYLRLSYGKFIYLQTRHWRFFNGTVQLRLASENTLVEVRPVQVLPKVILLKYRYLDNSQGKWRSWSWDILTQSACEAEPFRQLRALFRTSYLKG